MPARSWDTDVWVGSPAAIGRDVGWRAQTTLPEGLKRTTDWLQADPERFHFYEAACSFGQSSTIA
jgi:hypothetical protein